MSRVWVAVALLVCASPLPAGVYNLEERIRRVNTDGVRGLVLELRAAALPSPKGGLTPEHFKSQVLAEAARLELLNRDGLLTTIDRVNLSACYLRLNRVPDALRLLSGGDKDHFLIQSNLAAAYFLSGEPAMAVRYQVKALESWPEAFFAWDEGQRQRYRSCELALLRLYSARADEARRGPARDNLEVDPVFPGVRYVGPSGAFEAGSLAPEMSDRLPGNAVDVLTQLAVWFPTDMRLYWQLGQLLGAVGSIDQARGVAVELVEAGMGRTFKGLPQQRRALLDAAGGYKALFDSTSAASRGQLLATLQLLPRPLFAPPGIGDAAYAAGCAAAVPAAIYASQPSIPQFDSPPGGDPGPTAPVFNFVHMAVSFGFGLLVAALAGLQFQEWRRRRQLAQASFNHQPHQEGQGNGADHGRTLPAGGATTPADRSPGAYRLP
ncbi:MAG: hypothetical protein U0797_26390 [Gemmataceae bacterium]